MKNWPGLKTEEESIEREARRYRNMPVQEKWNCFRDIMNYLEAVRRSTGIEFFNDDVDVWKLWLNHMKQQDDAGK